MTKAKRRNKDVHQYSISDDVNGIGAVRGDATTGAAESRGVRKRLGTR
jgi:hypothetical protein